MCPRSLRYFVLAFSGPKYCARSVSLRPITCGKSTLRLGGYPSVSIVFESSRNTLVLCELNLVHSDVFFPHTLLASMGFESRGASVVQSKYRTSRPLLGAISATISPLDNALSKCVFPEPFTPVTRVNFGSSISGKSVIDRNGATCRNLILRSYCTSRSKSD